jgi:hypothetical protein
VSARDTAFLGPARALVLGLLGAFAALASAGGCSSEPCGPDDCTAGERCTQDRCSAPCATQSDCPIGENCALWEFEDGERGNFCVTLDYAADGRTGQFETCSGDTECDGLRGWRCLEGECRRPCRSHLDCADIGHCDTGAGVTPYCVPGAAPQLPGGFGTRCPSGDECAEGFACRGVGAGDFNAYCTMTDCTSDGDCGIGMRCTAVRTARPPCAEACGLAPAADDPSCVPADQIGADRAFRCGPISLVRSACVYREYCEPCETNADCLGVPDQICARDASGTKICTTRCDPALSGCPWGSASVCAVTDESLGFATCSHRFGSCRGAGTGCHPCVWDEDCASGALCVSSSFTGERFCLDLNVSCSCPAGSVDGVTGSCLGGGCPESPGGLDMRCLDSDTYAQTSVYRTCFGADVFGSVGGDLRTGCWPAR